MVIGLLFQFLSFSLNHLETLFAFQLIDRRLSFFPVDFYSTVPFQS